MILVDTSVWIELLNRGPRKPLRPDDMIQFVTCGPVLQEVFQGLRDAPALDKFQQAFLAMPVLSDPLPVHLYLEAADIYRLGRRKGSSIRSSTDCLIAAIAIENHLPVWHRDRDFTAIAAFTRLEVLDWS